MLFRLATQTWGRFFLERRKEARARFDAGQRRCRARLSPLRRNSSRFGTRSWRPRCPRPRPDTIAPGSFAGIAHARAMRRIKTQLWWLSWLKCGANRMHRQMGPGRCLKEKKVRRDTPQQGGALASMHKFISAEWCRVGRHGKKQSPQHLYKKTMWAHEPRGAKTPACTARLLPEGSPYKGDSASTWATARVAAGRVNEGLAQQGVVRRWQGSVSPALKLPPVGQIWSIPFCRTRARVVATHILQASGPAIPPKAGGREVRAEGVAYSHHYSCSSRTLSLWHGRQQNADEAPWTACNPEGNKRSFFESPRAALLARFWHHRHPYKRNLIPYAREMKPGVSATRRSLPGFQTHLGCRAKSGPSRRTDEPKITLLDPSNSSLEIKNRNKNQASLHISCCVALLQGNVEDDDIQRPRLIRGI